MNILLVQPEFRKSEKSYPLGLAALGAFLKENGHRVFGRDLSFHSFEEIRMLISEENIDLIGVSMLSYNFENAISFCRKIKKLTGVPIVAGGPHVTIFGESLLKSYPDCLDYVIAGEGEYPILRLVNSLLHKHTSNDFGALFSADGAKGMEDNGICSRPSLDCFPFPDRRLFPIQKYRGLFSRNKWYTQIVTSRGCNHHCRYCPEPFLWKGWRGNSIEYVVKQIESIVDEFGIREFHFEDANLFGGGHQRIKEMCKTIIERKLNIRWQCPNGIRPDELRDFSVLELMAEAGCYNLCLGLESFDDEILKGMNRSSDFSLAKKIVEKLHGLGMEASGYFMIGLPGQSFESIDRDIKLSRCLDLDFVHYSIFKIIPGSDLHRQGTSAFSKVVSSCLPVSKLKKIRFSASLYHCLKPRLFIYAFKRLMATKNPLKYVLRVCGYLFDKDVWL